jgi:hypothetical protein
MCILIWHRSWQLVGLQNFGDQKCGNEIIWAAVMSKTYLKIGNYFQFLSIS